MGDISVIARRLDDGHVQYGWSGNGGYFAAVGAALLYWYDSQEMVEYLFGLGQLEMLSKPGSESSGSFIRNRPTGKPHWLGTTEQEIFRRIAFVDYGYFYDTDHRWYYIYPSPFRIKIPLKTVSDYLQRTGKQYEFDFLGQINRRTIDEIISDWYENDAAFQLFANSHGFGNREVEQTRKNEKDALENEDSHLVADFCYGFYKDKQWLFDFFDRWAIARPCKEPEVVDILLRKKEEKHVETIDWKWRD